MKFAALMICDDAVVGGIESSAGYFLHQFEAEDRDAALLYCLRNRLRYVMPLLPPFGPDRKTENGHG